MRIAQLALTLVAVGGGVSLAQSDRLTGDRPAEPAAPPLPVLEQPAIQQKAANPTAATLERIAQCESGGDPRAIGGGGLHRGKYQFTFATWHDLGGVGDPALASEAEQDRRAAQLLHQRGTAPWPNCA